VIRWLLVGAGQAGQCHLAAIANDPAAELAGVVSLDPLPADFENVYDDITKAAAATSPDAIVLATPHDTHVPLALETLGLGLPLLCEKPVGRNADEARQVLAAANGLGVPVGVVLNQRAVVHHRWVNSLIANDQLKPRSIAFRGTLARLTGWHADARKTGGGVLRIIGLHYLDLLRWWLGEPETLRAVIGGGSSEERVRVTMAFASGAIGSLELTAERDQSLGPVTCSIESEHARVELNGHVVTAVQGLPEPPSPESGDDALIFGPGHQAVISEATAALAKGSAFPVRLADALPSLELVDRVYASADLAGAEATDA
jgi:predicted dehydrogenase